MCRTDARRPLRQRQSRAMDAWFAALLSALALPKFGLSTVFVVALLSATLLPLGSEPVVFGLVKLNPELFWPAVLVASAGNTVGGAISWWMGRGAEAAYERVRHRKPAELRALQWLQHFGPKACLVSWLPVVGDPLCALAGWLRLPFWPCVLYMAIGKFLRYVTMTAFLLWGCDLIAVCQRFGAN
jgi:membrane protein YqaA with SNARE-associated domain